MESFRREFIEFLLESDVLRFGDFITKSGRKTPYFINTGLFRTGAQLARLGEFYAHAIQHHFPETEKIDNLYGPAYKGIPLVVATSTALHRLYGRNLGVTFNRKEVKDHGEGGSLIGAPYDTPTRIVVVEDVITAGTAIAETMELFRSYPQAEVVGMVVSVDRKERIDKSGLSALDLIQKKHQLKAVALIDIDDLIAAVADQAERQRLGITDDQLPRMLAYREEYGAAPR